MNPTIEALTAAVEQEAKKRPEVLRLMTHPGAGPLTALAFVLIIGTPERFKCGKQIGSYVGLTPSEDSSAGHQRLGTSPSKAALCCVSCWEKQHKRQRVGIRTRDDGMCTWRCVGRGTSPRLPWPEDSRFGCTGCGEMVGSIRSG
jgi:transposase